MLRSMSLFILLISMMPLSGCDSVRSSWDKTQEFYKKYVNVDPEVELELPEYFGVEEKMAYLFAPVDKRIQELLETLDAQDSFPSDEWFALVNRRHPWLGGAVIVTPEGDVVARAPETYLKPLEIESLMIVDEEADSRSFRTHIQESALGPEVYVAKPFFESNELQGLIILHFDFAAVVDYSPVPEDIIVFTPEMTLWVDAYRESMSSILAKPWAELLTEDVYGRIDADGFEFYWLTRYIGDRQLIYAVDSSS